MLFTTRINGLVTAQPRLSRIWIKTGNPKTPLKAVWINESQLSLAVNNAGAAPHDDYPAELPEDHLSLAPPSPQSRREGWVTRRCTRLLKQRELLS
jgi:hypothetical protein